MFVRGSSKDDLYILNNSGKREKRQIAEKERDNRERGRNYSNGNQELKEGKLPLIKRESLQELRYIHF